MKNVIDLDLQYNGHGQLEIIEDPINPINYHDYNDASTGWRLDITAKINDNGDLEVYDTTPYEQWDLDDFQVDDPEDEEIPRWTFLVMERVVHITSEEPKLIEWLVRPDVVSTNGLRLGWIKPLTDDGLYHYQKLIIPYKDNISSAIERLYYHDGKIYHVDSDSNTVVEYEINADTFDELYDLTVEYQFNNCYYASMDTFSIYNMVKCYVLKEKERINNYFKNDCGHNCKYSNSQLDMEVDILLSAIMVLEDLVSKGFFFEAQRILNGFDTCGGLCRDVKNNLKGCGCGKN